MNEKITLEELIKVFAELFFGSREISEIINDRNKQDAAVKEAVKIINGE